MKLTGILVLTITVLLISPGCVDKQFELEQLASVFSEIPVVPILFPTAETGVPIGSATVIGDRELLLSPHQLHDLAGTNPDLPKGPVLVDNCFWIYSIVQRVDGPTDASGWAIIRLSKLGDYSRDELRQIPIIAERTDEELNRLVNAERRFQCELPEVPESVKFDFRRDIPRHRSVAVAYLQTVLDRRKLKFYDPDLRYQRKFRLGCVYKPLVCPDARLEEFLLIKAKQPIPQGASGSPAYILGDDNKTVVIIGIAGGAMARGDPNDQVLQMIRRPHELDLPLNVEDSDGNKEAKDDVTVLDSFKAGEG